MFGKRVYWWGNQRQGNYQIRIGKKKDMAWFKSYLMCVLRPLNKKIGNSTEEPKRRYYVEQIHINHMEDDPRIDLKEYYVWKENKRAN